MPRCYETHLPGCDCAQPAPDFHRLWLDAVGARQAIEALAKAAPPQYRADLLAAAEVVDRAACDFFAERQPLPRRAS